MDKNKGYKNLICAAIASAMLAGLLAGCYTPGGTVDPQPVPIPSQGPTVEVTPQVSPEGPIVSASPIPSPVGTGNPSPQPTPVASPVVTPVPQTSCTPDTNPSPSPEVKPTPTPKPTPVPTPTPTPTPIVSMPGVVDSTPVDGVDLEKEAGALSQGNAAVPNVSPTPSGEEVKESAEAEIDYSNAREGYVMVRYNQQTSLRLKARVQGPTTTYTYNLTPGIWAAFPLSDGNGAYQITVYKNVTGTKYASVLSVSTNVTLNNQFAPFLHSNQYVNYAIAPNAVVKASQLTAGISDPLKKVEAVYNFVVNEISYDRALASSVSSGYLPNLDYVLAKRSGICFDYAALMTGMLRSQGVPCKLVVGYAGSAYHAWISVWSQNTGWIDGVIFFNGSSWQRMDPTFASSGNSSESILQYIGNGSNYSAKYFY